MFRLVIYAKDLDEIWCCGSTKYFLRIYLPPKTEGHASTLMFPSTLSCFKVMSCLQEDLSFRDIIEMRNIQETFK